VPTGIVVPPRAAFAGAAASAAAMGAGVAMVGVTAGSAIGAAILLAESPEEPPSLVLSPRAFVLNRVMRCDEPGPIQKFKLLHIVQRGGDFERVAFEHVDPSF